MALRLTRTSGRAGELIAGFLKRNQQKFLDGKGTGGQVDMVGYALWAFLRETMLPMEVTSAVAEYLLLFQKDADYWKVGSNRPPSEASSITTSYLAIRGLERYATEEQQPSAKERRKKALKWFIEVEAEREPGLRLSASRTAHFGCGRSGNQTSRRAVGVGKVTTAGGRNWMAAKATPTPRRPHWSPFSEAKHWTAESPSYRQVFAQPATGRRLLESDFPQQAVSGLF